MKPNTTTATRRSDGLRQMLTERRRTLQSDFDERLRGGRADRTNEVRDTVDLCDVGIEEELSFALLQMGRDALARVDAALAGLDAGTYGTCFDCGTEIATRRLQVLPFAVRCQQCEANHEAGETPSRGHADPTLFPDVHGV